MIGNFSMLQNDFLSYSLMDAYEMKKNYLNPK
jgi:hypothetical protein